MLVMTQEEPLKVVDEVECADESTLCLSLEWSTRRSVTFECVRAQTASLAFRA